MKEPLLTQPALPRDLAGRPSTAAWELPAYEGSSLNMRVERNVGSSLSTCSDVLSVAKAVCFVFVSVDVFSRMGDEW